MISGIDLQNFRSYKNDSFEFDAGVNVIVGPNASGKTNLLESILVVSVGSSYRAKSSDLIMFNQPWAKLSSTSQNHSRMVKLQKQAPLKDFIIDGKQYARLPADKRIPVVLFEPAHLQLLSGSPDNRRTYLDEIIERTVTGYGSLHRKYLRALSQRNGLLKQNKGHISQQIFPWNVRLSQLGGQIVKQRQLLTETINSRLGGVYIELGGGTTKVRLEHKAQFPVDNYESHHINKLENNLKEDIAIGHTTSGPHRDDFMVYYNSHPASLSASRGELRTAVLALKIIELDIIKNSLGAQPLFLLDDVFSELDSRRRQALIKRLRTGQSFITTTDADTVVKQLRGSRVLPMV